MPRSLPIAVLCALSLAACSMHDMRIVSPGEIQGRWLDFLKVGESTREDVLLKLGHPAGQFEGGRILTYRLAIVPTATEAADGRRVREKQLRVVRVRESTRHVGFGSWLVARFSLTLVFDGENRLAKTGLVQVR